MWHILFDIAQSKICKEFGVICEMTPNGVMKSCRPDYGVTLSPEVQEFLRERCMNNLHEVKESLERGVQLNKVEISIVVDANTMNVKMEAYPYVILEEKSTTQEFMPIRLDGWHCCDKEGAEHVVDVYAEEDPAGEISFTLNPEIEMEDHEEQALMDKLTELLNRQRKE